LSLFVLFLEWIIQVPESITCLGKYVADDFEEFKLVNMKTDRAVQGTAVLRRSVQLTSPCVRVGWVDCTHRWVIVIRGCEIKTTLGVALHTVIVHQQHSFDKVPLQSEKTFLSIE
jgi:hypothetical protein